MPAERFYIDAELKNSVSLSGQERHHLIDVMRARIGDEIELVNGKGSLAKAKISAITKRDATLEIFDLTETAAPIPRLNLIIPLMRPSKLELDIEKCTELGADAFFLYAAEYSEKKELSENSRERLKNIAIASMKQCGRLDLPPIHHLRFDQILDLPGTLLFGDPRKETAPKQFQGLLNIITGPERGFSPKELKKLEEKGVGIKLHKNVLRAETAPIAALMIYTKSD